MYQSRIIIEMGDLRYQLISDWLKLPPMLSPTMQVAAVAVTHDDCLYALTRNHEHPIMAFDPEGKYMGTIGADLNFGSEHGLYVTSDDCLLVCDSARHVIYKLNRKGEVLMELGSKDHPCDNGFDPVTPYPYCLFTIKRAGEPFNRPTGAAEAPDGSIWCCDGYGNASIHHFTADGKLIGTYGAPGQEPGQFVNPHSIWVDQKDRVWVCDRDNHRVQVFNNDGSLLKCFPNFYPIDSPYGPSTLWSDGKLMFFCCNTHGLGVYDIESLEMVGSLDAPNGSTMLGHSMCGDSKGNLYIGHLNPQPMVTKLLRI